MSRPAATSDHASWQPQVLDQLRRELGDDDGTMIAEIIALYLAQARKLIGQLTAAAAENDESEIRELAHSLKGSSLAVGATELARLCQNLESAACPRSLIATTLVTVHEEFDRLGGSLGGPAFVNRPQTFSESDLAAPTDAVFNSHDANRA